MKYLNHLDECLPDLLLLLQDPFLVFVFVFCFFAFFRGAGGDGVGVKC